MNISGINPNLNIPATNSAPAGSGSGTELRSLEQKLAQLQKEKKEEEKQAAKKQENGQEQPAQLVSEQMLNRLA